MQKITDNFNQRFEKQKEYQAELIQLKMPEVLGEAVNQTQKEPQPAGKESEEVGNEPSADNL